jgi:hypothetical protein
MSKKGQVHFVFLLICLVMLSSARSLPKDLMNDSEGPVPYCVKNDPHVRIFADIKGIELIKSDANIIGFRVQLTIHIVNTSSEPVIILAGEPLIYKANVPVIGPIALARTKEDAITCRYIIHNGFLPARDRSAEWMELGKALDCKLPPEKLTRTIAPGVDWEFERNFTFGVWDDLIDEKYALDVIRKDPNVWFQVDLLMWPNNLEKDMLHPEFGLTLRERWKDTGYLIIDNLRTEPISICLPIK